jgi:pyruvate/2-oxoglutarate dehydrogenase complex dihydrolipoamide acyltransferase (E2) component
MFKSFAGFGAAALIALGVALGGSTANAESVMKQCGDQWQAAKAAGTTNGQTWPQFLSQCRAQLKTGAVAPSSAAVPAAPASAPAPAATMKTAKECDAEYAANKAAIKASGQTKRAFVAACRAGNETIPQGAAAPAPMPAPAAAPAPAPTPAATTSAAAPMPMGAGEFASEQQARYRCPSDTVVWVNKESHVYHFAGTHNYGHTKQGAYMCEADAKVAGDRAAKNEKHP